MIKSKKSLIAVSAIILVVAVGITYALIFSSSAREHLFSLGNYNVVTSETFTSPASWQPGVEIPKTITATNNGDIQAAFRVKYTESWKNSSGTDITSSVPSNAVTVNLINTNQWTYNSDDGYYYYNYILEPGKTSSSLISGFTLNQDLASNVSCNTSGNTYNCSSDLSGYAGAQYTITFTKETVVYSKYQSFWNTNQTITEPPLYTLPYGKTESNLQVGDEICVVGTDQCFNFIRYDGNNIVMLAKYNLKVGNTYSSGTLTGEYTSSDTGYGLQSSDMKGYVSGQNGTVAFSGTNYWDNNGSPKSYYPGSYYPGPNFPTVYDSVNYKGNPGNNDYSVAYYVEIYKDILETYGLTIQDARLLTYSEATDSSIGCSGSSFTCPTTGFITNTSFWLGSAVRDIDVWSISSMGFFNTDIYSNLGHIGVRPVIVVAKSNVSGNYDNADAIIPSVSITIPSGRTKDNLQIGDEICVEGDTTECFNFIRYDGDNVVMLSKWNLKVGNIYNSSGTKTGEYSSSDTGYGLQSSEALGYVSGQTRYGTVAFSGTNYWYDGSDLKSKYGSAWNTNNIYDTDYSAASGTNYSVAYYVDNYKDILETYGLTVQSARLLTYSEAKTNVGCGSSSCPTGFIRNTSFWLGSANSYDYVRRVYASGTFNYTTYSQAQYNGVRPVIVINKNAI